MKQDVNRVIDKVNEEWARDMSVAKRKLAIQMEENRLLQEENRRLAKEIEQLKNDDTDSAE